MKDGQSWLLRKAMGYEESSPSQVQKHHKEPRKSKNGLERSACCAPHQVEDVGKGPVSIP